MAKEDTFEKLRKLKKGGDAAKEAVSKTPADDIKGADFATLDKLKAIAQKKQAEKKPSSPSITSRIEQMKEEGATKHEMYARLNQEGNRPDETVKALEKEKTTSEKLEFFLHQYKVAILVFGIVFVLMSGSFFIFSPGAQGGGEAAMDFASMKADFYAQLRAQDDEQRALEAEQEPVEAEVPVAGDVEPLVDAGGDSASDDTSDNAALGTPSEPSVPEEEPAPEEIAPVIDEDSYSIAIRDAAYVPSTLTIEVGDTVVWTNEDITPHSVTADDGAFDSGSLAQGEPFTRTFSAETDFEYSSSQDSTMTGTLIVGSVDPVEESDDNETDEAGTEEESAVEGDAFEGETFVVSIANFKFEPQELDIEPGTRVKWVNDDTAPHTVTADDGSFDSGTIAKGESFSFIFEEEKNYPYSCTIHTSMTGSVNLGCEEDWSCTAFGTCAEGVQTRTCTDNNACGTQENKPNETQPCCVENWVCDDFSPAVCPQVGKRTRSCSDSNSCGTELNKPAVEETCTFVAEPEVHDISIENMVFNPDEITVNAGDTIRWTNNDNVGHTILSEDGAGSDILAPGDTFEITVSTPGETDYSCSIHPSMTGSIIVQ